MYMTMMVNKVTKDNNAKTMEDDARCGKCERVVTRVYRDASGNGDKPEAAPFDDRREKSVVEFKESQAPGRRRRGLSVWLKSTVSETVQHSSQRQIASGGWHACARPGTPSENSDRIPRLGRENREK